MKSKRQLAGTAVAAAGVLALVTLVSAADGQSLGRAGGSWYSGRDGVAFPRSRDCPESTILVTITTDTYPSETTWQLVQQGSDEVVCSGGPYLGSYTTYSTECCVTDDGCYDFTIYDTYGDGIYAPGGYEIRFNGASVASTLGFGWCCTSETVTGIGGCIFEGACCYTGDPYCAIALEADCIASGGSWLGARTACGVMDDCDGDGISDGCAIGMGLEDDCNGNGIPDSCDIASGYSHDCEADGIPDECQEDCNGNGIGDGCDLWNCHLLPPEEQWWCQDCQPDGIPDGCQLGEGPAPGGVGLFYAPSDPDNAAFRAAVSALIGAPVDYFDARSGTPTVAQMKSYAAVLTWTNYAYADGTALGNNLADYADAGGIVILGQWCVLAAGDHLSGRIMWEPGYNPATATSWGASSYAGDGGACMHKGVVTYEARFRDNISLVAGAISDGTWLDGIPAVAYWPNAIPPVFYSPGHTGGHYTTGDWALLTANIITKCVRPAHDCNANLIPDDCDIAYCDSSPWCQDCNDNGYPDICDPDCDADGIPDECEIGDCPPGDPSCADCNGNHIPDGCDIANCATWPPEEQYKCADCQPDGIPDGCQLGAGRVGGEGLLYAPSEADNPAFRAAVSAMIGAPVDYYDARVGTPTAAQMQSYAAVLTWPDYVYADSIAFGNHLADYVDAGGRVILGQSCLPTGPNHLHGRIMTEPGYNPATATTGGGSSYAGDGVTCIHDGVTAYSAQMRDNISLMPGATSDGHWLDGIPAVAYWPGLVPQVFYSPGNTGGTYTTGDWARLTANMVYCWPALPTLDCNGNLIPDDCDIAHCDGSPWCRDCNDDGRPDGCECASMGDLDNNGLVDGLDIQGFIDCALGGGDNCLCGDFDCNGNVGLGDLPGYVNALLTSP